MKAVALDARLVGRDGTGDSTYWLGLLHGLSRIDAGFKFLLFSNAARPGSIPDSPNFEWMTLDAKSGRWWSMVRFPLAAKRMGASVVHTQYNLSPLARNGITTVHDVSFFIGSEWFKPKDRLLLQQGVRASVARAKRVITVSQTSRRDLETYLPQARGKAVVTPLARSPLITPMDRQQAQALVRQDFGLEPGYMLTVGTRWPRKNMSLAIQAADLLDSRQLVVTGKAGWGEESTGKWTKAVGYVSDAQLSALYSAADLYLAPSRYEGFGLPLLEAFACGCPVICSAGGALPEVAGDAAIIQSSDSPEDWARTMRELLNDPSKLDDMRSKGIDRERQFSWTRTAEKTVEAYKDVINDRS
jgi:glycosyltransferase involved in cell wall biosynthesis